MLFANPVPSEFASGQFYNQTAADYYLSAAKLESDYAPVRFERELRLFRKYCSTGSVLDVGCSSGAFLFQLRRQFPGTYEILGTDVSGSPLDYAQSQGIPVVRGNFLEGIVDHKKFDAITFWAVLEHIAEPAAFIETAEKLLNPAGICFVLVPNMKSLATRLLGVKYRYIYPQHLNYFTQATLLKLCSSRFSVLKLSSTHFNPVVIWQDWRRGGSEVSNEERARLLQRTTAYKQNPLLGPLRFLYRSAEKLLAATGLADNLAIVLRRR
jgi:2-polyprenyl-3-methyl-5-hydroxy-6-metoxy-1,4-benzoquinol methylase